MRAVCRPDFGKAARKDGDWHVISRGPERASACDSAKQKAPEIDLSSNPVLVILPFLGHDIGI